MMNSQALSLVASSDRSNTSHDFCDLSEDSKELIEEQRL